MRFNVARVQFEIGCNATFPLENEFLSISSSSKWFYRKVSSANGSNFLLLDFVSLNQDTCPHVASPSCTSVLDDGHKQLAEDSSLRLFIKKSLCDCNLFFIFIHGLYKVESQAINSHTLSVDIMPSFGSAWQSCEGNGKFIHETWESEGQMEMRRDKTSMESGMRETKKTKKHWLTKTGLYANPAELSL